MSKREGTVAEVATLPLCDFCKAHKPDSEVKADFDGKTRQGPWANMCATHYGLFGIGLGVGKGQRLVLAVAPEPEDRRPLFNCPEHGHEHRLDATLDCFDQGIQIVSAQADPYAGIV